MSTRKRLSSLAAILFALVAGASLCARAAPPPAACQLQVVDKETHWPVPMVELETVHYVKFVTDNAGRVAFDLPEMMGKETWLSISGDGYEVPADGYGKRGVRVLPKSGETITIEVIRTNIAKRLGRLTGAGQFGESQKLGLESDWQEYGEVGCDSVQNAVHNGRLFWIWGDTSIASYSLGIFDSTAARTSPSPLSKFEPPLKLRFDYFTGAGGSPRGVAKMPGKGPTWIQGLVNLPDQTGTERLCAMYLKSTPPMELYETGLCVWNDKTENFEHVKTVWTKSDSAQRHPTMPQGHSVIIDGDDGQKWALFGDPLPVLKCPATFEDWQDQATWKLLKPQENLASAVDGKPVKPASGAIARSAFRKRWVTVFMQVFGAPSGFGEVWYAEADSPFGPWGPAVKVLSHKNYSYYNPTLHAEFSPADSPVLVFEGTHSQTFANHPAPTPRYDYNQVMYRLDLDDPKLAAARMPPK
ncbi:MAG TPA: hypothetical protein VHU84_13065 [Lacipirellulaceae bacterium]|nr:hypothetical protein [Lacipirellulaceae bacterium]